MAGISPAGRRRGSLSFSQRELRDLAVAWIVLSGAFAVFLTGPAAFFAPGFVDVVVLCVLTVGVGFMLHELAHKVVAVRFGQQAAFRADYSMLFLALMGAFVGFIFAAPGAVYHRGRITPRENGLIALAGPVTNLVLAAIFLPLAFAPVDFLASAGAFGVFINVFLAAFNMIPFGPLDGKTVLDWSKAVFAAVFVPSVVAAYLAITRLGWLPV
ncbi:Zn-dependent protease (includes SpoIVFB) [Natronoarchaeum philippinense]|uniref:Zn-dependent protease (Includes SpoIVFB) n=1 Tax=Natronoarchaeum philippinense TaxID=558529 RepID=A0A285N5X5_NATPI|nr:metalloprotease [Natronoarchaeum philippinense]SNZ04718.1 Zn-dependent protease (includes SpoIVFB) [Natronoarchaeum philippinense]